MTGWIVLALLMSANSTAVKPPTFKHVRSAEPRVRELIAEGYLRSATFRERVDTIEKLSCVVYVGSAVKLSRGMRGALLLWTVGAREMPVLRVLLKTNLSRDDAIAVIGHELQHVVEAMRGAPGADPADLSSVFEKLQPKPGPSAARRYETEGAIDVTTKIHDELRRSPAPRSHVRAIRNVPS